MRLASYTVTLKRGTLISGRCAHCHLLDGPFAIRSELARTYCDKTGEIRVVPETEVESCVDIGESEKDRGEYLEHA